MATTATEGLSIRKLRAGGLWHAVGEDGTAACGARPAARVGWAPGDGADVTCPACRRARAARFAWSEGDVSFHR